MTADTVPTWWEDHQAFLREAAHEDPAFDEAFLSAGILALLAEVEDAFAQSGVDTPAWEDPHRLADGSTRDSVDAEYSRCLDPDKYRILWSRGEAWARVLTQRGWADETVHEDPAEVEWAVAPLVPPHRTTVLQPRRSGAERLVLARITADDADEDSSTPGLIVGLGAPVIAVEMIPACGCDACDSGSRDLLESLDSTVLSIVDGSFEATVAPTGQSTRSSFGAESGSGVGRSDVSAHVMAQPWAENWTPRPLCPAIDPLESAWADEALEAPPSPWRARIGGLRRARSGTATSVAYARSVEQSVTAPLDALENVPAGYRRFHRSTVVEGMSFEEAASALSCWVVQRRAGLQVRASNTPLEVGTEVWLRLGIGKFAITAPCRVIRVIDEPDRKGFAYAALPGHPESGIEEFTVTRTATGLVRFHLDAVSKPATWYARLGSPVSRVLQELITRRYLRALSQNVHPA